MSNTKESKGNTNLRAETRKSLEELLAVERPELLPAIREVKAKVGEAVYARSFSRVDNFNRRGEDLLIVVADALSRSFIERDCIPALKEAFGVKRVRVVGC